MPFELKKEQNQNFNVFLGTKKQYSTSTPTSRHWQGGKRLRRSSRVEHKFRSRYIRGKESPILRDHLSGNDSIICYLNDGSDARLFKSHHGISANIHHDLQFSWYTACPHKQLGTKSGKEAHFDIKAIEGLQKTSTWSLLKEKRMFHHTAQESRWKTHNMKTDRQYICKLHWTII